VYLTRYIGMGENFNRIWVIDGADHREMDSFHPCDCRESLSEVLEPKNRDIKDENSNSRNEFALHHSSVPASFRI
jgi:hypothetical protein